MANQVGARFLAKNKREVREQEEVCTNHYRPEISVPVKDGVRKRRRVLKRKVG